MKIHLASLTLFSILLGFAGSTYAAELLVLKNDRFALREFSIDATQTKAQKYVACSPVEIHDGVWNLFSFSEKIDNSARKLNPTYDPLSNGAAWLINNSSCAGLKPYFNGVGFESFDRTTGRAVIYLAAFIERKIDPEAWAAAGDTGFGKAMLFFQPDFDVQNLVRFDATCEAVHPNLLSRLGIGSTDFVCTLARGRGTLRLEKVGE